MGSSRGQILERKKGYLVRVFVGRAPDGRRVYENQKATTKKDAERALTAMLRKLDTGELLLEPSKQTVREYGDEWLTIIAKPRVSRSTFKNYCHYLRVKVYPTLGHIRLLKLEPRSIQKLYSNLSASGLSGRSVRYTHTVLNSALEHAVEQRYILSNPCRYAKLPRLEHNEMSAMSELERKAFLEAAKGNRMQIYFELMMATGLRPAEGLALKWSDFDPVNKTLKIVRALEYVGGKVYFKEPKTKRSRRTINLHDETITLLLGYKPINALPDELIFVGYTGEPLNTSNVLNRYFKPCLLKAGLATLETTAKGTDRIVSKFRMYDLCHTHATMLLEANVNPKIVSERLGHTNITR